MPLCVRCADLLGEYNKYSHRGVASLGDVVSLSPSVPPQLHYAGGTSLMFVSIRIFH